MGVAFLMCECVACHQMIMCNPLRVPSIFVHGTKEPLCKPCAEALNSGKELIIGNARYSVKEPRPIHPEAYEPCDERELP